MKQEQAFALFLRKANKADNTIHSYLFAFRQFSGMFGAVTKANLLSYKAQLLERFKPPIWKASGSRN